MPTHMFTRRMTREDIAAGLQLCRLSGWNQIESDWRVFLELNPDGCRVAEKNGQVVGTVATIRYQDRFSWLAMMLVHPQERGTGIGTHLLSEGLKLLSDQPCVRLDATPAGRPLYQRHQFVDEYALQRMTRPSGSPGGAGERGAAPRQEGLVRRMETQDLAAVSERDRGVFGADRHDLLRILYGRAPEFAWIAGARNVEGYCFGRPGFRYSQLGPVVAKDERVAAELIQQCLLQRDEAFVVDAPERSPSWLDCLRAMGFSHERKLIRMYRGENTYRGAPEYQFGILGPEFG